MVRNITEEGQKRIHKAQLVGASKSHERRLKNEEEYCNNPNICQYCGNPILQREGEKLRDTKVKKFCSHSCSASFNNQKYPKRGDGKPKYCKNCNEKLTKNQKKYCCKECDIEYKKKQKINEWLENPYSHINGELPNFMRNYLIAVHNNSCELCGWGEENQRTKLVPLQIHHKDGNYRNNILENLQILCPNCHSLTFTYGSGNKGNGREHRYK